MYSGNIGLYYDIFVLDILKDHMAFSLHKRIYDDQDADHVLSIAEFTDKYHLTRRESEILMHILSRQDNASISEELVISLNTLKKHEMNIYRKCGVSSRMQLFKLHFFLLFFDEFSNIHIHSNTS